MAAKYQFILFLCCFFASSHATEIFLLTFTTPVLKECQESVSKMSTSDLHHNLLIMFASVFFQMA